MYQPARDIARIGTRAAIRAAVWGSPGWSFFLLALPALMGIAVALVLPMVRVVLSWLR